MSVLESYWPSISEINKCIKAQAESSHESLILAVHQPMSLWWQPINSPSAGKAKNEEDLLKYFLTKNLDTGTLIVPITGASGSGKSHAIRWLNAQLLRRGEADRFHIIRVPKSASLRTVIQLILDPLKGKQYEQIQEDLKTATEAISLDNAVIQFRAGLEMALKQYGQKLKSERADTPEKRRIINPLLGHIQSLPKLFNDSNLSEYFDSQVLSRIIKRAVTGQDVDQSRSDEDNLPQFRESDLELPVETNIGLSAHAVQSYYLTILDKAGGREKATEVLNAIVDEAIRNTFKLNENLGGKTLQEIILEIRINLLKDEKELILLVEDFAALTGIQETLLNICIQEAIRPEGQVYCVMRTALALTDGYLGGRDTIATRAKYEWVVRSELDTEDAIINQVINLTGAYLNAARYGEENVKLLFENNEVDSSDSNAWLTPFKDENIDAKTEDILESFERSAQNNHLFPFNSRCLKHLATNVLTKGGKFLFNPRDIIDRILRETLLYNRDYFLKNLFPQPDFHNAKVKADIAILLNQRVPQSENKRYQSFLTYWGGNPENEADLHSINPLLYEAFGLQPLTKEYKAPEKPSPPSGDTDKPKDTSQPPEDPPPSEEDVFSKQWDGILEDWVNTGALSQINANHIRKSICEALEKFIDWNVVNLRKPPLKPSLFWIPGNAVRGNPSGERIVKISDDYTDSDGKLRRTLLAILRHREMKWTWDYPDGPEDSLYYANYLDKISLEVVPLYRDEADKELIPLAQGLLIGNLLLGSKPVSENNTRRLLEAILFECSDQPTLTNLTNNDKWDEIRVGCSNLVPLLQTEFKDKCACFQGTGKKSLAINYVKLNKIFKEISFYEDIQLDLLNTQFDEALRTQNLKRVLKSLNPRRLRLPTLNFKGILKTWLKKVNDILGEDFDKEELLKELEQVIKIIKKEGNLWPQDSDQRQITRAKNDFRESPVVELLENLKKLPTQEDTLKDTIPILVKFDPDTYKNIDSFIIKVDDLMSKVEQKISAQVQEYERNDPTPVIAEIESSFKEISSNLVDLSGGNNEPR